MHGVWCRQVSFFLDFFTVNRNNNRSNLNNNTKAKPVYDVFGSEDDEESDDEVQHYSQTNEELLEIRLKDVGMR